MEEISACRACLATDAKLYNMFKYELISAYENLTGLHISQADGRPQQICSFCAAILRKCAAFRQKCRDAEELLSYAIIEDHQITDYINSLNRQPHNLTPTYTTTLNIAPIKQEELASLTIDNDLTSLLNNIIAEQAEVKMESSDEEPLAKIVKKNKNCKKKVDNEAQEENLPELSDSNDLHTIKDELVGDLSPLQLDECFSDNEDEDSRPETMCDDQIEVVVLSKDQQVNELQERKNTLNYINSFYKCDMCYRGFMLESTYQNHMQRHAVSFGRFACDVCQLRFQKVRKRNQHVLAAHSRNYICKRCGHVCKAKTKATEHYKWHQGVLYTCNICGASFDKPTTHLSHVRISHPSRHICPVCGVSFVSENGLKIHGRRAHKEDLDGSELTPDYKCVFCGILFNTESALEKHVNAAFNGTCDPSLRPCIFCGENFVNEDMLKKHAIEHQNNDSVEKSFDCEECNKTFKSARYHALHYRRVHARLSVKPQRCGQRHNAVCEICGKKCTSKATLVYHQRTHSGEKPYQCNECPKRFSVLQRLQIHIRTHTGERPCQCPHCPKAFKHKAALNRHVRVHTGVKPYSCPHCNKSFSQSNSMKGHVRSVHLKLPALYRRANRVEYSD